MSAVNRSQKLLLSAEYLFDINPLKKYQILFDNLNASALNEKPKQPGRHPVSKPALLRALIYKCLKPLPTLSDLVLELTDNPSITLKCGLAPSCVPPVERFSSFLSDTDNTILQKVRNSLVKELITIGEISGKCLSIDSYPIPANVRENNLKTNVKDGSIKPVYPKVILIAGWEL
jgi:transposase